MKKRIKRNPEAKALASRLFRQRVVVDKKKEEDKSRARREKRTVSNSSDG